MKIIPSLIPNPGRALIDIQLNCKPVIWTGYEYEDPVGETLQEGWNTIADWGLCNLVRQRWYSKFKLKKNIKWRVKTEKLGAFLNKTLDLCSELSSISASYDKAFSDWEMFEKVINQMRFHGLSGLTLSTYFEVPKSKTKKKALGEIIKNCSKARSLAKLPNEAHSYPFSLMLQKAINLADQLDMFRKNYYFPFINAWKEALEEMGTWDFFFIDEGELRVRGERKSTYHVPLKERVHIQDEHLIQLFIDHWIGHMPLDIDLETLSSSRAVDALNEMRQTKVQSIDRYNPLPEGSSRVLGGSYVS